MTEGNFVDSDIYCREREHIPLKGILTNWSQFWEWKGFSVEDEASFDSLSWSQERWIYKGSFLLWPAFIQRGPGVAYTPKPPHFHRVRQFVDIFTGTREKREDLYLGNSSKRVPILRGCKRCGGKGKEKEGVTLGETLKHLGLLGHHHTGRVARKADYRVCGLLTMIRNIRKKMIKRTVARLSRCHM